MRPNCDWKFGAVDNVPIIFCDPLENDDVRLEDVEGLVGLVFKVLNTLEINE